MSKKGYGQARDDGEGQAQPQDHGEVFRFFGLSSWRRARIQECADGRIWVQTVAGHLRMQVTGNEIDLPFGHLLALDHAVPHGLDALQGGAFLLSIACPSDDASAEGRKLPFGLGLRTSLS